jgi:3-methyladenine DNA glycosylase AlkD
MATTLRPGAIEAYHQEVVVALRAIGNPEYGRAVQKDRGSQLEHLGISFPDLRKRVKQGFSFYSHPEEQVLEVWAALWQSSPYGDVLFAALEHYLPRARKGANQSLWPVVRGWAARVDNWCHCDLLSSLYSHLLPGSPDQVFPQLCAWNEAESEWLRRISLVSLIHYSGTNAVFLPPETVLPLVSNCLDDSRHYVQTAVGWVLREMGNVYPEAITAYLDANAPRMGADALSRAIERRPQDERARLRALRAAGVPTPSDA